MAETKTPEVKEQPLDWAKAKKHLESVEAFLRSFAGKPGYNPFMAIRSKVAPLKERIIAGGYEKDSILYNNILALSLTDEPTVVQDNKSRLPDPKPLIITRS